MLTRMQQRRGTAAEWSDTVISSTVVLAAGEVGLETDTGRFKIGNGSTVWSNLPYYLPDNNPTNASSRIGKNNHDLYVKLAPLAPGYNQTITGINVLVPQANTQTPLTVAGISGQTALLQSWRSSLSVSTPVASISSAGKLTATGASFTDDVQMNNKIISGLKDIDGSATDSYAVNKKYVDEAIAGLAWKSPVNLVSASALNTWVDVPLTGNTGTVTLDGHAALTQAHGNGYRLLLINQTTDANNGIWEYSDNGTTYTLSRPTDADTAQELRGASVFVEEGSVYGTSSWVQTDHYITTFASQEWVQFNGASQITAGNGLTKSGNVINAVGTADRITANADSIDIASTYVGQTSITTLGTVTTGTWTADTIAADQGGTGQSSYTVGDILYASSTSALSKLPAGTIHYPLVSGGTGADPLYAQIVTAGIADSSSTTTGVTYSKIQYVSGANKILGRITSGSGIVEELNGDDVITIVNTASSGKIDTTRLNTATGGNYGSSTDVARKDHTHTINDLSDVIITGTPAVRQVIKYNGSNWVNELPSGGISTGPTPPTEPSNGDAWFDTTDGSLYVRYDDGVGITNTNYVLNPTFAAPGDGLSNWSISSGSATRTLAEAYSGLQSMEVVNASFSSARLKTDLMSVTAGQTYTASVWVKKTSSSAPVSLWLEHYDSSDTWLNTINTTTNSASTTNWQRIVVTKLIESPTAKVKLRVSVGDAMSGTSTAYIDAAQFELGSSATTYFDGSLPGCSWTGTAHLSTSTSSTTGSSAQWVQVKANSALEASILTRMSAVEARDTKLEAANAVRVANQAERDATYPSPVQGNTVFRADLGYEEKYYAAYNATTNPDGTTGTIGWYRYAGGAPLSDNVVINGAVDYWQRGAGAFSGNTWNADRFYTFNYSGTSNTTQVTLPLADAATLGTDGIYMLRLTPGTAGDMGLITKIEDVRTFAGDTVTISFWAKTTSGTTNFQYVNLSQEFGTGGSTSVYSGVQMQSSSVTTSWKRFIGTVSLASISGKTIGTGSFLQFRIDLDETFTGAGIDFTGFQVELGPVATPFRRNQPNPQAELAACQRYWQQTYPIGTPAGTATSAGALMQYVPATGNTIRLPIQLGVRMRIAPTVNTYGAGTGAAGKWQYEGAGTTSQFDSGVTFGAEGGFLIYATGATVAGSNVYIHYTANAEL